ncbi:MAG: hypothetical protein KatS3mg035_1840 [Bacteroidia bacterium]|nr:MAG: hypothetical protein KatS3mg035_1840 [Bacteroidia bacterium]
MGSDSSYSSLKITTIPKIAWLFCFLAACNQENSLYKQTLDFFTDDSQDTLYIKKPTSFSLEQEPSFRYQLVSDTSFVSFQDTISFEIYKDIQSTSDYYLNCFKNHTYHYSIIISPQFFSDKMDTHLIKITQISEPEILYFSKKYQKLFLWFNLGLPNQQAFNKGLIGINEKGKNWFTDIVSNLEFNKYQYFVSKDEEAIILGNYVIQLEEQNVKKIKRPFIFSGFLNSQSYFILDDPIKGDTFVEEKLIDEWGNEKIEYYRITVRDSQNKNLFIFNLQGDTLYKIRFDGICEDESFGKQISFVKSDTLKIGIFYDFHRKFLRIFDLVTLHQKIIYLKDLTSDYPENLPYIDIPINCYLQDSMIFRGEKKLRLFFQQQKPAYYLFLYEKN